MNVTSICYSHTVFNATAEVGYRAAFMDSFAETEWLLLLYFLPAKRARARVQAWRRLQRVGAVAVRNSAYVLPHSPESREDFEWIKNEVVASGGEAMVLTARAPDRAASDELVETFRAARAKDFEQIAGEASKLLKRASSRDAGGRRQSTQRVRRLRERFETAVRLDFFDAPGRDQVAALLAQLDQSTGRTRPMAPVATKHENTTDYRGRRWLTRARPGVDRMSSAWLIRRFIDPEAAFIFGEPSKAPDTIPFDTFEAEFGHQGSNCTFETLCQRFAIDDSAVLHIGRIVHDLDLKESRYKEADTETVGRLVEGLRRAHRDDDVLLRAGMDLFEALYQSVAARPGARETSSRLRTSTRRRRTKS
jgi:hypothetical protein